MPKGQSTKIKSNFINWEAVDPIKGTKTDCFWKQIETKHFINKKILTLRSKISIIKVSLKATIKAAESKKRKI